MSLPTRNAAHDRLTNFIPTRILPAGEVNQLQQRDTDRLTADNGAIFRVGGTLNVTLTSASGNVSLSATDPTLPMLVFVRGSWEIFQPITLSYSPSKTSGNDFVYLNYVIWRVTLNVAGTINDSSLVDVTTGEPVGEMGQLEITVSSTDTSIQSGSSLNATSQFELNATPIIMFTLQRGAGGSITPIAVDRTNHQAIATIQNSGPVLLSFGSTGVAVATDDPRLGGGSFSVPLHSLSSRHIVQPFALNPIVKSQYGYSEFNTNQDTAGILAGYILHSGSNGCLEDIISYLLTMVFNLGPAVSYLLAAVAGGGGGSAPAPVQPPVNNPQIPANHVGFPLGLSNTHPALVNSDTDGYTVERVSSGSGSPSNNAYALKDANGALLAGMTMDGDIVSSKTASISFGSTPLSTLSAIATALASLHGITGGGGGSGTTQTYVDTQDAATLASAKSYTDSSAGASNVSQAGANENGVNYDMFTWGHFQIAFGGGNIPDGTVISPPTGFVFSQGQVIPALSIINCDFSQVTQISCAMSGSTVQCYATLKNGTRVSGRASVSAYFFRSV